MTIKEWSEGQFSEEKIFYVYEWFNKKTGYVFYVGKGSGDRYRATARTKRNRYFVYYVKKHSCEVRIVCDNLSEKEAFDREKELIASRKESGECCCNFIDGGASGGPRLKGGA